MAIQEHREVEELNRQIVKQDCKVKKLEATVGQLQSALKAQAAQIQKVSDQLGHRLLLVVRWRMIDPLSA